MITEEDWFFME